MTFTDNICYSIIPTQQIKKEKKKESSSPENQHSTKGDWIHRYQEAAEDVCAFLLCDLKEVIINCAIIKGRMKLNTGLWESL